MIRQLLKPLATRALRRQVEKLQREVDDLTAELEGAGRKLDIANVEIESMAAVIARDRARVEAESAGHARHKALNEGVPTHGNQCDYPSV